MKTTHKKRMQEIGKISLPPKGTREYELALQYLEKSNMGGLNEIIKKRWEKSLAIVTTQQMNGSGHQTDQSTRWFQKEYNGRTWTHGLHSLPSSFNVAEAFFEYNQELNSFILLDEANNLFSFPDYVDWYTSYDKPFDLHVSLEKMETGVIYTYDNLLDPADLLYKVENGKEVAIAGFAMVRFGTEITIMCVGGECADLEKQTQELIDSHSTYKPIEGRNGIKPDPSLSIEAVALESKHQLWKIIGLTRFDIENMSQSVRYIMHDNGISFQILTDDPTIFFDSNGDSVMDKAEERLSKLAKEVNGYNALFDLCSSALFLPLYFDEFSEDIVVERFKTDYSEQVNKVSFRNIKKNTPIKYRFTAVS